MKVRQGFVSNSSSASFIVHWRARTFGNRISLNAAIARVFGVDMKENGEEFDWENAWNKESQSKVEEAARATVENADGSFTSSFWTSMMNTPDDFGDAAKSLVMGIVANEDGGFQLIDARVEGDN